MLGRLIERLMGRLSGKILLRWVAALELETSLLCVSVLVMT